MKSENKQNQKGGTRNVSNSNTRPASSSPNSPVGDNTVKNPDEWTTGEEPMTGAQHSYLKTLSHEAGEEFNDRLTKAEASKKIDELQHKTGRGLHPDSHKGA